MVRTNYAWEQFGDSVASPPWVGNVVSDNGTERSSKLLVCRGTAEGRLDVFVDLKLLEMVRKPFIPSWLMNAIAALRMESSAFKRTIQ